MQHVGMLLLVPPGWPFGKISSLRTFLTHEILSRAIFPQMAQSQHAQWTAFRDDMACLKGKIGTRECNTWVAW